MEPTRSGRRRIALAGPALSNRPARHHLYEAGKRMEKLPWRHNALEPDRLHNDASY